MKFVKDDPMNVKAMLCISFRRQHLIKTPKGFIYKPLLGDGRFDSLFQRRALIHHIDSNVKYDGCLLPIRCAAVDFAAMLKVAAGKKKCNRSSQLGLSLFFGNLDVSGVKLPVPVWL